MKLALMQPYLFPYIGYYQLVGAVDRFVFYDDVNYIKNGWINRNRLVLSGDVRYFTVPLADASPYQKINEVRIWEGGDWRRKMLESLRHAYRAAPHYAMVSELFEGVIRADTDRIADLARLSVTHVASYLGMATRFVESSVNYGNAQLRGPQRVIDICQREGASDYVNMAGGRDLYDREAFAAHGVRLHFLEASLAEYPRCGQPFHPGLSIIDALMHQDPASLRDMIGQGRLA